MNTLKKNHSIAKVKQYNEAVKTAYFKLLKETTRLIATVERHELRFTLQRSSKSEITPFQIVHEFISPLVYFSLRCMDGERYFIQWGFEQFDDLCAYSYVTAKFVRMLYKFTAVEHTLVNIEDCIDTDSIVTHCSELYECVDDNNHHHQFMLIKHRPQVAGRKQMQAVA